VEADAHEALGEAGATIAEPDSSPTEPARAGKACSSAIFIHSAAMKYSRTSSG
jgi:hypothetical protein